MDPKEECTYGDKCYRLNKYHLKKYRHEHRKYGNEENVPQSENLIFLVDKILAASQGSNFVIPDELKKKNDTIVKQLKIMQSFPKMPLSETDSE